MKRNEEERKSKTLAREARRYAVLAMLSAMAAIVVVFVGTKCTLDGDEGGAVLSLVVAFLLLAAARRLMVIARTEDFASWLDSRLEMLDGQDKNGR